MISEDKMQWQTESNIDTDLYFSEYGACTGCEGGLNSLGYREWFQRKMSTFSMRAIILWHH